MTHETPAMVLRPACTPRVHIDPSWKPLLWQICALKDALDHAFRWQGAGGNEDWINATLRTHGLDLEGMRGCMEQDGPHFPEEFVQMILGAEFKMNNISRVERRMVIPPWAVLGWVRRQAYMDTPAASKKTQKFEARDVNEWDKLAYTFYWSGFPLFLAGEGKNRTQLQRLAGVHRRAPVYEMPFPVIQGFVASPVPFFPWAVAIRSDTHTVQVLPFRQLTEPLVKKLGLQWCSKPSWAALLKLPFLVSPRQLVQWARIKPVRNVGHLLRMRLIAGRNWLSRS